MSEYFDYYIGYKQNDKIYPLGPYNAKGELLPAYEHSSSFGYGLPELIDNVLLRENASDSLIEEEIIGNYGNLRDENDTHENGLYWTYADDLFEMCNHGDYIKSGYFLLDDIRIYKQNGNSTQDVDIFYDKLDSDEYAMRLQNELIFGPPLHKKDECNNDITDHSIRDYGYFAYADYYSKEYIFSKINAIIEVLIGDFYTIPEDAKLVVIMTRG